MRSLPWVNVTPSTQDNNGNVFLLNKTTSTSEVSTYLSIHNMINGPFPTFLKFTVSKRVYLDTLLKLVQMTKWMPFKNIETNMSISLMKNWKVKIGEYGQLLVHSMFIKYTITCTIRTCKGFLWNQVIQSRMLSKSLFCKIRCHGHQMLIHGQVMNHVLIESMIEIFEPIFSYSYI